MNGAYKMNHPSYFSMRILYENCAYLDPKRSSNQCFLSFFPGNVSTSMNHYKHKFIRNFFCNVKVNLKVLLTFCSTSSLLRAL